MFKPKLQFWTAIVLIGSFLATSTGVFAQVGATEYITLNVRDTDITDVIKIICNLTGVNIIQDKSVKGRITLMLRDVHYEKALELICKTNGYNYRKVGNTYVIATTKQLVDNFEIGLNKTFKLQFATADDVAKIIKEVFKTATSKVDVSVDKRINAIVVAGSQDSLEQVEKLVKTIDVPVHQVMIEAKIVEVSTEGLRDIGLNWDWGVNGKTEPEGTYTGHLWAITECMAPIENSSAYNPAAEPGGDIFKFGDFFRAPHFLQGTLTALEKSEDAKTLSNPKVSALNGEQATIHIGRKVIYGGTTDSPPQEKDVGVILKVTPRINDDGFITCEIEPEVSFVKTWEYNYPKIEKRTAKTVVRVKDGEEILIGGLISENDTHSEQRVPILGSIPLLKSLFSRDTGNRTNTELIILITPHIMKGSSVEG